MWPTGAACYHSTTLRTPPSRPNDSRHARPLIGRVPRLHLLVLTTHSLFPHLFRLSSHRPLRWLAIRRPLVPEQARARDHSHRARHERVWPRYPVRRHCDREHAHACQGGDRLSRPLEEVDRGASAQVEVHVRVFSVCRLRVCPHPCFSFDTSFELE